MEYATTWISPLRRRTRNGNRYTPLTNVHHIQISKHNQRSLNIGRGDRMRQNHDSSVRNSSMKDYLYEYDETEKLREENLTLKQRLNVANNTIRELEYVCNKNNRKGFEDRDTIKPFCNFIPRKLKSSKNASLMDDHSLFSAAVMSQASTVRMGSSSSRIDKRKRKKKPERRDEKILLENQEIRWQITKAFCPASCITNPQRHNTKTDITDTAPCTPERSSKHYELPNGIQSSRHTLNNKDRWAMDEVLIEFRAEESDEHHRLKLAKQNQIQSMKFLSQVAITSAPLSRIAADAESMSSSRVPWEHQHFNSLDFDCDESDDTTFLFHETSSYNSADVDETRVEI